MSAGCRRALLQVTALALITPLGSASLPDQRWLSGLCGACDPPV